MPSRIRKNSKRLKRSNKQKKYIGGITMESGLYAIFVNKKRWEELFGQVAEGKNAPSISDIYEKLHDKAYLIKNETRELHLIGAYNKEKPHTAKLTRHCVDWIGFGSPDDNPVKVCRAAHIGHKEEECTITRRGNKSCSNISVGIRLNEETVIQDILTLIQNVRLFSVSDDVKNYLNVDCCVLINVNRLIKNKYVKLVEYINHENREMPDLILPYVSP